MSRTPPDGDGTSPLTSLQGRSALLFEEFRRRNVAAVAMDLLYLFVVAFFAVLLTRGWETVPIGPVGIPYSWPAVIGGFPLVLLLYFGWRSSKAFLVAQLVTIVVTIAANEAGLLPL